jgi:hypothetical protein
MNRNELATIIALATMNGPGNTRLRNAAKRLLKYVILPRISLQGRLPVLRQQINSKKAANIINSLRSTPEVQAALVLASMKNRR